jgi:hypothetical protein
MSRQRAARSGQERAATDRGPLPTARFIINLLWQFALPGLGLLFFAYRDRYDGKPDYVVPWLLFAAIIGAAWTIPIATRSRHRCFSFVIPMWIWPWLALAGALLHRQ